MHIDIAFIDEDLVKGGKLAPYIPEVDVEDFTLAAKVADSIDDGIGAHLRDRALAEFEAVVRARNDVDESLHALVIVQEPADAVDVGNGWVVRVRRQLHSSRFRDGDGAFQNERE